MKNVLFGILVVLLLAGAAFAQEGQELPDLLTVEGRIVIEKSAEGKDLVKVNAGLVELVLQDNAVLRELLKTDKVTEKVFVLEGEKIVAADGETEIFVISSFREAAQAPVVDDHGHGHGGHDHGSHDGHNH